MSEEHNLSIGEDQGNRIVEAVVFSDQAYLKRQARVQVEAGLNRILMELQAFSVDRDSAQAKVYGQGEIHLFKVQFAGPGVVMRKNGNDLYQNRRSRHVSVKGAQKSFY